MHVMWWDPYDWDPGDLNDIDERRKCPILACMHTPQKMQDQLMTSDANKL